MSDGKYRYSENFEQTEFSVDLPPIIGRQLLQQVCCDLLEICYKLEKSLLWVIHEQCEYSGKVYAKLLIHGEEAFKVLGLEDGCSIEEIERRLFKEG